MQQDIFIEEVKRTVRAAEETGIVLRVMGACAVRIHCPKFQHLHHEAMKRELTDLDFIAYGKFNKKLKNLFVDLGYIPNERFITLHGAWRHMYYSKNVDCVVDVFFDKLEMCHTIDFKGRLELDSPTITLADLILQKTQIVEINEKDIKDVIVLLREHEVGETENETINAKYIAKLLSSDWGFYYTVTTNLGKIKKYSKAYEFLREEDLEDVSLKIDKLLEYIEKEPKSLSWRMRAGIGPKKKWYRDVETVHEKLEG